MNKNPMLLALLTLIAAAALWYSGKAVIASMAYDSLNRTTPATFIAWIPKALSDDQFILEAHYRFTVGGKEYSGTTPFRDFIYRNAWAAEQASPLLENNSWPVFYAADHPEQSTLKRAFPYKECASAVILWCLFLYFLWLSYRVTLQK